MATRVCSRCGGPLPASQAWMQRCEFCGAENERAQVPVTPFAPPPPVYGRPVAGSSSGIAVAIAVGMVLMIGLATALIGFVGRSSSTTVTVSPPGVFPMSGSTEPPPVALSALHTTALTWTTDVKVDAPNRVGTPQHFDPIANWEWVGAIGTAWWPDAKLFELTADPIQKDGTVNLTGPPVNSSAPQVEYHFVSQDCHASEKKRVETAPGEESSCSLAVQVTATQVAVRLDLIGVDRSGSNPIKKPECTIEQAFTYLDGAHKLTTRPSYAIRLVNDVFGHNYSISAGQGSSSMDAVDVSPTFCSKALPNKANALPVGPTSNPTSGSTSTSTSTSTSASPPFDRHAAISALNGAGVESCRDQASTESIRLVVTFQPDGSVSSATVNPPYAGTPFGKCAAQKELAIHVPSFSGSPVTVSFGSSP